MMNTKEVAEYLDIHEKQVYVLIKENKIPCTKITGKWIFPKSLVDEWILSQSKINIKGLQPETEYGGHALLAAGSNDPVVDILLNELKEINPLHSIFTCSTGSLRGIHLLSKRVTHIAWSHLYDPKTKSYNIPFIQEICTNIPVVIIHLFYRKIGIVLSPGITHILHNIRDIIHPDIVFINRQEGSGIRVLTDYLLKENNINPQKVKGYTNVKYSHIEVGLAIQNGEANAGIASVAIANFFNIPFIPLTRESFDMIVTKEIFFNDAIQSLLKIIKSDKFRKKMSSIAHYDFNDSGDIVYSQ